MRLNLGCGYVTPDDWVNVDIAPTNDNVVQADILEGLPYPTASFDFVLLNCVLQLFTYDQLPSVLEEVRRVMRKKATLRILTPDLDKAISAYGSLDADYFPISDSLEPTISGKFARYLFWHGESRCAFTFDSLADLLKRNGFRQMRYAVFGECPLDSRPNECFVTEAIK